MSEVTSPSVELLAESVLRRLPELTDELVRVIEEQNPAYRELDAVPRQDLWTSCHDNVARVVRMIAEPDAEYFDAAQATGRRRAEQRMPLDDVLKSFRLGGRLVWEALINEARAHGMAESEALLEVAGKVWEVVDRTSSQVAAAYHAAERYLVRVDEQRRWMLWEGLLHGRTDRAFLQEAATVLDVPVDGRYLVVAIDNLVDDEDTTTSFARRLAGIRVASAWQVRPQSVVGLLALGPESANVVLRTLREVVHAPAGLSSAVAGLGEVDVAYRQAMLARRTLPAGRIDVAPLPEHLPEALLLSAPELAELLVQTWLVPLMTVPAAERALLLDTLDKWVLATGSVRRTAELAHCHRNTVLNRLHRIGQITGRNLADEGFQLELGLALRAFRLFPPRSN